MSNTHEHHDNSIYYKIFGSLLILTVITVALTKLEVGIALGVTLALIVASMKASLVASVFMHLIAEKKSIYLLLILTGIFFVGMIALILGSKYSTPQGTVFLEETYSKPMDDHHHEKHAEPHSDKGGHH